MKREKVFSKDGVYEYVVDNNVIMHNEAKVSGLKFMQQWLSQNPGLKHVSVLDLACGGKPVTIAAILCEFPQIKFSYTGIDINPDQVTKLKNDYQFTDNVTVRAVLEGNAWELDHPKLDAKYDVIFSGLNLHHGVPEELFFLAREIRARLNTGGMFFGHDLYRPEQCSFVRRPDVNPGNPDDVWLMTNPQKWEPLPKEFLLASSTPIGAGDDWRIMFTNTERAMLNSLAADSFIIDECLSHMYQRDFSLSLKEMKALFELTGFCVEIDDYAATPHPLKNYFGFLSATSCTIPTNFPRS